MIWRVWCFLTCYDDENWLVCQGAAQFDLIKSFSQIRPSGGLKGEEKLEKIRYL